MNEDMTPDEAMDELVRLSQEMGLYEVSPNEITAIELNFDKTRATHLAILFNGLDTLIDIKTIMKLIQNHFKNPKLVDFPFGPIPNWIKSKDFLPTFDPEDDDNSLLVLVSDGNEISIAYYSFHFEEWFCVFSDYLGDIEPIWWMPLPPPPKEN